jgi:hypothetical protein
MGNPDRETLPSNLARRLNEGGLPVRILNLAQTGFVSTQELLALLRELQKREPPDLLVVYDGVNEALGYSERPDLVNPHYLMGRITALFEGRETRSPGGKALLGQALEQTALARLAKSFRHRLLRGPSAESHARRHTEFHNDADLAAVGERSADCLIGNYELMRALGDEYGFSCFFFFQPQIGVSEKPLHESEQEILADLLADPEDAWIIRCGREQRRAFQARLAGGRVPAHVYDISDVFAKTELPLCLDWCHVSHNGNRLLADRIGGILLDALCAEPELLPRPGLLARLDRICADAPPGGARDGS